MDLGQVIQQAVEKWKQNPSNAEEEKEVIDKYGKMFNPRNLDNLTAEDFKSFLNYENNKHWTKLERKGPEITQDMGKLKKTLKLLLDETIPIDKRIERIRDKNSAEYHRGFGPAYYTPVLMVVYPEKYPVINSVVKAGLRRTGLYPDYGAKPEWVAYSEVAPKIVELAKNNKISLWQMDSIWFYLSEMLDYEGLYNFISKDMDPKATYQPILIRTLLEKVTAPKEDLDEIIRQENPHKEKDFVSREVYEVLVDKHKIVKLEAGEYKLNLVQPLTTIETEKLIELCNQKIARIKGIPGPLEKSANYWIFVVTDHSHDLSAKQIYQTRMNDKFWGLNERTPYRNSLRKGDRVIFSYGSKTFLGTALLDSDSFELDGQQKDKFSHDIDFYKPDYGVLLSDIITWNEPKQVNDYAGSLSFVGKVQQYPVYFQGGIKKISKIEFDMITGNRKKKGWLLVTNEDIDWVTSEVLNEVGKRLEIDPAVIRRIISHLILSKHVILVGPPGTGKTDIARRLLRQLGKLVIGDEHPIESVASYEWGRYEVIGGKSITSSSEDESFHPGCVTQALMQNKFLLIDEFNRADMNKAFGEMFLAVDHGVIQLRGDEKLPGLTSSSNQIAIPSEFRMICTMNDYDKALLNELSYGLLRRFAFVEINVPNKKDRVLGVVIERVKKDLEDLGESTILASLSVATLPIDKFIDFMLAIKQKREIGLSSYIDVIRYLLHGISVRKTESWTNLNDALTDYILPQFDRLDVETLSFAYDKALEYLRDENKRISPALGPFLTILKGKIQRLESLNKLFKIAGGE